MCRMMRSQPTEAPPAHTEPAHCNDSPLAARRRSSTESRYFGRNAHTAAARDYVWWGRDKAPTKRSASWHETVDRPRSRHNMVGTEMGRRAAVAV